MSQIETAIRGGIIALILVLAALAARNARRSVTDRYAAIFVLGGIPYLIESAPALAHDHSLWIAGFRLISIANPALFWLWIKAQFDEPFVPSWRHWLPWFGMAGLAVWAMTVDRWLPWRVTQIAALALVGLGIWRTLAGRGGDLVESSRRLRLVLAIGVALYIIGLELITFVTLGYNGLATIMVTELALGAYVAFAIALRIAHEPVMATTEAPLAAPVPAATIPDPEELRLLDALRRAMEVDKAYREEDCSIAGLAARLGIPEYRLRRLINQRLGHRNFTTYINGYRLAETTAALADPSQARVPILTIALDAGFQSLGPFNRAFKAHTGMTPSEFRRDRLGNPPAALRLDVMPPTTSPIPKSASV